MTDTVNRIKQNLWIKPETKEAIVSISEDTHMNLGQVVEWLVKDYQQRKDEEPSMSELTKQIKQLRAAVNQSNLNGVVAVQLLNSMLWLNGWKDSDLYDTSQNPANGTRAAIKYARDEREAAIKAAKYRANNL